MEAGATFGKGIRMIMILGKGTCIKASVKFTRS